MDPSNLSLFWSKNFRCAPFHPLLACQNCRPELLSLRRKFKKYEKFVYCPNRFFAICFIKLSSRERVETIKFSTFWYQILSSPTTEIPIILFPLCFSRDVAITLFALQPFGNFWRFLFWVLFTTLSFKITQEPVPVVQTIWPHAVYPLDFHTRIDGRFSTHSRASTSSANNLATCRLSIAHSR